MKIKYIVRDACGILFSSFDKEWAEGVCHGYNHFYKKPDRSARYYIKEEVVPDDHKIINFDHNKGVPCHGSFKIKKK